MAIPDSPESDERVTRIIVRLGGASMWIGYTDRFDEAGTSAAQFRRTDNDQEIGDGFDGFNPSEPNDSSFAEDCVEARANGAGWNDIDCDDAKPFVCEFK